jgi:GTPase SAR1 family protein
MAANSKTFQFKLVLLGDSAVGKSSLVLRCVAVRVPLIVIF